MLEQSPNAYAVLPEAVARPDRHRSRQRRCRARGAIHRPALCTRSGGPGGRSGGRVRASQTPRTGWRLLARLGRAFMARDLVYRVQLLRRNLPQIDPTCHSRSGPADRRKQGASNRGGGRAVPAQSPIAVVCRSVHQCVLAVRHTPSGGGRRSPWQVAAGGGVGRSFASPSGPEPRRSRR